MTKKNYVKGDFIFEDDVTITGISPWQQTIENLATNTVSFNVSSAMFQKVVWESGSRTPTFTGFNSKFRSFLLEIDVSDSPTIDWSNVDEWMSDGGFPPLTSGHDKIRIVFDSYDNGTTVVGTIVGVVEQ